ncbi:MAG TPA: AMP-binding protein [Hyphomicrobiaceae bacterium]|nr:AMP-binding protein [Hyphomicrobiaceae bacterium]
MAESFYDNLEIREPKAREDAQFNLLPDLIRRAVELAPGWARHLKGIDPAEVTSREALACLPVLRKSSLSALQARRPPFGGLATAEAGAMARIFMSPGPIFEPEGVGADWWRSARALHAAGFRKGDVVHNTFSYHLTPGGWIMDAGARALGCTVIPAGPANPELQIETIARLRPTAYLGVPEYLKTLLDAAREAGRSISSIRRALVSGGVLTPALREEYRANGIDTFQAYATADVGIIAYESAPRDGLVVDEGVLVEIVRPGTGEPVSDGEIGEVVVTSFNRDYPMIRLATGDLSAVIPGPSPCGRTNMRIRGWLGRADQAAMISGVLVNLEQLAAIGRHHPELGRMRLVVRGEGGHDGALALEAEAACQESALADRVAATLGQVTGLPGKVKLVDPGALPRDGVLIADERKAS